MDSCRKKTNNVPYRSTVNITPPLGRSSMVDVSSVGIVPPVHHKGRRWKHLAESFPKMYRSVLALLAPSWVVEQSSVENRPRAYTVYHPVRGRTSCFDRCPVSCVYIRMYTRYDTYTIRLFSLSCILIYLVDDTVCFSYCVYYLLVYVCFPPAGNLPLQSYWSLGLSCDHGLHCSDGLT